MLMKTRLATAALALAAAATPALAEFPEKPVQLIVPFSAGGGTDALARAVQASIEKSDLLPVPVAVVNADGAAGTVGSRSVLSAEPDGHTILQIHQEMFSVSAIGRVEYSPEDFEPVIQATRACMFVAVPKESEFQSMEDLIAAAEERGRGLKQADAIGSATHFPSAQLMQSTDTRWTIVPTGGTSKRFAALKGGFSDFALLSPPWVERGAEDLRALAVAGPDRYESLPDVPTLKELGHDVEACLIRRYWAPKGTPEDVIAVLADAIEAALNSDEVQAHIESSGEERAILRGEELRDAVAREYQSFLDVADVVRETSGG
ncbi:tripartite tricarboxylate transporter substrate binding protein [Ponticoccus gilvus]|nr:tripartite tricarboxylate transporter substrate binding protein [Enemella evansiae]